MLEKGNETTKQNQSCGEGPQQVWKCMRPACWKCHGSEAGGCGLQSYFGSVYVTS